MACYALAATSRAAGRFLCAGELAGAFRGADVSKVSETGLGRGEDLRHSSQARCFCTAPEVGSGASVEGAMAYRDAQTGWDPRNLAV